MKISKEMANEFYNDCGEALATLAMSMEYVVSMYEYGRFPGSNKVKDLQCRFCFDLFHFVNNNRINNKWNKLYTMGYNDEHIYTMLRSILPKIERKY